MAAKIIMDRSRPRLRLPSLPSVATRKECNAELVYLGLGRINLDPLKWRTLENQLEPPCVFKSSCTRVAQPTPAVLLFSQAGAPVPHDCLGCIFLELL